MFRPELCTIDYVIGKSYERKIVSQLSLLAFDFLQPSVQQILRSNETWFSEISFLQPQEISKFWRFEKFKNVERSIFSICLCYLTHKLIWSFAIISLVSSILDRFSRSNDKFVALSKCNPTQYLYYIQMNSLGLHNSI